MGYTFKIDFQEVRWGGINCNAMTQDWDRWRAVVSAVMNLRVL